jgi:demethylmenaquinone methyltransferase/2-methoxy-6-polyprenyl-1,4-benzoquinol methylase
MDKGEPGRSSMSEGRGAPLIDKDPARIAGMFDAIAPRYDALNHFLSAGFDRGWRRRAVRELELTGQELLVDMCTGTGDLAIEAATFSGGSARQVIGIDFAGEMLRLGLDKIRKAGLSARVHLARGDAAQVPLRDVSCDAAMVAFGIRNVRDPARACEELVRVLRPGGRLAILEFGSPSLPGVRALYRWYFRRVLPRIGRLVSKHGDAYSYLPVSVAQFPAPREFAEMLRAAGFTTVRYLPLTWGVVYLYVAQR